MRQAGHLLKYQFQHRAMGGEGLHLGEMFVWLGRVSSCAISWHVI